MTLPSAPDRRCEACFAGVWPGRQPSCRPGANLRLSNGPLLLKHMFAEERQIAVGTILRLAGLADDNYLGKAAAGPKDGNA